MVYFSCCCCCLTITEPNAEAAREHEPPVVDVIPEPEDHLIEVVRSRLLMLLCFSVPGMAYVVYSKKLNL